MLESDARKGAFLRTAQRELALNCHVVTERIEAATPQDAQVVTARALAPLPKLLSFVDRHLAKTGTAILQKGANWEPEVEEALVNRSFKVQNYTSITDGSAVVLTLTNLERR
jgi:16S rRNA (guanine527-N7)-methyltransferase